MKGVITGLEEAIAGDFEVKHTAAAATCGACKYGRPFREGIAFSMEAVECYGAPPTPGVAGMTPTGPAVIMMRPRPRKTEPACALFARRIELAS